MVGIPSCKSTQNSCFICGQSDGRSRIPANAVMQVWTVKRLKIPAENRCCKQHLQNGTFTQAALELIHPSKEFTIMTPESTVHFIHQLTNEINKKKLPVDFEINSSLSSDDYELLLGLTRAQFDNLMLYCKKIKNSVNRSQRNAVAMLLMKLRLNLSQRVLAYLFGIENLSVVSEAIESVSTVLESEFVPAFLGYSHMTREEVLQNHSSPAFQKLLGKSADQLLLILDGTYLYIQKPSDLELQRRFYSLHKHRNLLKSMMVVTTSGRIVECEGLFAADGHNNDSAILKAMLKANATSILHFLEPADVLILDRGFRDVVENVSEKSLEVHLPNLLERKQKQFSTAQANESRQVTMARWIVESVNGRIKNKFHFFESVIKNSYIPKLNRFFRIGCALINAYSPPIFSESEEHNQTVDAALVKILEPNYLQAELEARGLIKKRVIWLEADCESVPSFPVLSLEELKMMTLGVYQINMAPHHARQHLSTTSKYKIYLHKEDDSLIRAKIQSRFSRLTKHNLWIAFVAAGTSHEDISGWYCTCKTGARTLGCCSHVASVVWYLAFARHNPDKIPKRRNLAHGILDAAELCAEESEEEEDEDDSLLLGPP